jgi:SAM-dependent methyltransferase
MPSEPDKVSQAELQARFWAGEHQNRRRPDHPVVEALYAPRAAFIASLVKAASQASILDIGCGNGFLTCALERHFSRVVGLDSSASMLALNPCRCKCQASALQLPFADGAFDVVVESHVLHHIAAADRERVLREMMRVARETAVCYEPNRNNPLVFGFGLLQSHERMALRFPADTCCALCGRPGCRRPKRTSRRGLRPISARLAGCHCAGRWIARPCAGWAWRFAVSPGWRLPEESSC